MAEHTSAMEGNTGDRDIVVTSAEKDVTSSKEEHAVRKCIPRCQHHLSENSDSDISYDDSGDDPDFVVEKDNSIESDDESPV